MEVNIFKIIAVIGLLILTLGVISKNRKKQNIYFLIGGLMLVSYSIYIKDIIIISVQLIFTIAAAYNLISKK